jgi:hypothetical protein
MSWTWTGNTVSGNEGPALSVTSCRTAFAHDHADRLMADSIFPCRRAKTGFLRPHSDLRPLLFWDARSLCHRRIPANPRSPSRLEQLIGIQEWYKRQLDHVYLA